MSSPMRDSRRFVFLSSQLPAGPARPPSVALDAQIFATKGMATYTEFLSHHYPSSPHVNLMRHWLKVMRIAAARRSAEMVQFEPGRNRPFKKLIDYSMNVPIGSSSLTISAPPPVPNPKPTPPLRLISNFLTTTF